MLGGRGSVRIKMAHTDQVGRSNKNRFSRGGFASAKAKLNHKVADEAERYAEAGTAAAAAAAANFEAMKIEKAKKQRRNRRIAIGAVVLCLLFGGGGGAAAAALVVTNQPAPSPSPPLLPPPMPPPPPGPPPHGPLVSRPQITFSVTFSGDLSSFDEIAYKTALVDLCATPSGGDVTPGSISLDLNADAARLNAQTHNSPSSSELSAGREALLP